jgi:CheY-like chemotaxis protein
VAEILVVDDERNIVSQWRQALRPLGHELVTFLSAKEALAACDERRFDLIVVDFLMPEMTGVELINEIRKKIPGIRTVLISGKLDRKLDADGVKEVIQDRVEVDIYLKKPVQNETLREAVRSLLDSRKSDWVSWAGDARAARGATTEKAKAASDDLRKHLRKK